ncbi:transposase [Trichonephila clavipes]|nr:transposase [Trichonephila clavipes]
MKNQTVRSNIIQSEGIGMRKLSKIVSDFPYHLATSHRVHDKKNLCLIKGIAQKTPSTANILSFLREKGIYDDFFSHNFIWSEANPQVYVQTPLHPDKLTVWCALWAGGIIGPYIFKNDEGHKVTVNGDRYRAMITNFFIPELNNHDVQELWFQQDGATCHTARATIDLLKDTFGDRLISRFGPVNWPP